jgi:D,D-heptose 1,7-bisphosphate phosphatase
MEAIVLAGGFGTRLQSVVNNVPKPMADINGKPFLEYILEFLKKNSITRVILSIGYKKEVIESYFGKKFKDIEIIYSKENEPLGTGGAIKKALSLCKEENVFVLNGDTFFDLDLAELMNKHIKYSADVTLSLKKMYEFDRYGKVLVEKNRVVGFTEKTFTKKGFVNGGIYVVKNNLLNCLEDKFSFEKDFLEQKFKNLKIYSYVSKSYFIDIGVPEDYKKAIYDLSGRKALFLDRDGIVNIDYGHVFKKEDFIFVDGIFELCKFFQDNGYLIFIVTNQAGIAKNYYDENDFKILTEWMLKEFSKNGINISDVYYCPHHPTEGNGKYLQKCYCRKPAPKMLTDIQEKYKISLKNSILIGDKETDIEAGERAGIGELVLIKSKYQKQYDFSSIKDYLIKKKELL